MARSRIIANLGDVNPLDYGGLFVLSDGTMERLEEPCEDSKRQVWTVSTVALDRCTYIDGVLSDNKYHPDFPAWFADSIDRIASCVGIEAFYLIRLLCSDDVIERAWGYQAIADYHGWYEFDQEPVELTRREAYRRFRPETWNRRPKAKASV
jgi:hypothetical protein